MAGCDTQILDKRSGIRRERVHVISIVGHATPSLPAVIKGHAAIAVAEMGNLGLEHVSAEKKPVRKHDRLAIATCVGEVDVRSVQIGVWHVAVSQVRFPRTVSQL